MDRMQFVDQITALDLQIAKLREQMTPIRKSDIESDRLQHDHLRQKVQQLAEQKAELRIAFANS
jgi:FtsZ-binding cell division protein ZapB